MKLINYLRMTSHMNRIIIFLAYCGASQATEYCTYRWTEYKEQNVPGQQLQGGVNTYTEQSCMNACIQNTACRSIDYNHLDKTCWFGYIEKPFRNNNVAVNHHDLMRVCSVCTGGSPYTWTLQPGRNAPGLTQQGGANSYSEESCKSACLATTDCWSIDWNDQDKTCWHGTQINPSLTSNTPVNHWDLARNMCTTESTIGSTTSGGLCTYKWTEYKDQHVPGLQRNPDSSSFTEQSCKDSCIHSPPCSSIDYNTRDMTCWFGYTPNPWRASATSVNHFDLVRDCSVTISFPVTRRTTPAATTPVPVDKTTMLLPVCTDVSPYTWTSQSGRNVPGLAQYSGASTEEPCKSACLAKSDCWSVDWNDRDKSCWHGTQRNPTLTNYSAVTHWDLTRNNDSCRLTVVSIGDWGDHSSGALRQDKLAQVMSDWCGKKGDCAFVISTGDNFYDNGVSSAEDPRFNTSWRWVYDKPNINNLTWYITLGNHDYGYGIDDDRELYQVTYSKFEPRWVLPWLWYDFVITKGDFSVHYIMIDSSSIEMHKYDWESQLAWYNKTLADSKADWKVVVEHVPPYTFGYYSPGSKTHRDALVPAAEKYGVDFFISGHDHNIQHVSKITNPDIDYIISAGGGRGLYAFDLTLYSTLMDMGFQPQYFGFEWGFVVQEFKRHEALTEFINIDGKVIYSFTRTKPQRN